MSKLKITIDRASKRTYDANGHLRVADCVISRAVVNDYLGSEIPDSGGAGVQPRKIYKMYRDAGALKAAAPTFAGKPILLKHVPISADDHPRDLVVGAIGEPVQFDGVNLRAPLNIWDKTAIDAINDGSLRDLSCGYFYTPDMRPGVAPNGECYDGRMLQIAANHLSLVPDGRVSGAYVADANPADAVMDERDTDMKTPQTRIAVLAEGAVLAHLRPRLAADAKINLRPVFAGLTVSNFRARIPTLAKNVRATCKGKLAKDADLGDLVELLNALSGPEGGGMPAPDGAEPAAGGAPPAPGAEGAPPAPGAPAAPAAAPADPFEAIKQFLEGKLAPDDMAALVELIQSAGAAEEAPPAPAAEAPAAEAPAAEAPPAPPAEEPESKDEEPEAPAAPPSEEPAAAPPTAQEPPAPAPAPAAEEKEPAQDEGEENMGEKEVGETPAVLNEMATEPSGELVEDEDETEEEPMSKAAMDAAIKSATQTAVAAAIAAQKHIREAERHVRPWVGELPAMDSADAVYQATFKALGHDVTGIHPSAYKKILELLPKPGDTPAPAPAMDAASSEDFTKRFPGAARIRVVG